MLSIIDEILCVDGSLYEVGIPPHHDLDTTDALVARKYTFHSHSHGFHHSDIFFFEIFGVTLVRITS